MPYSIIWSPKAELTYRDILEFLEQKWTLTEVENFARRVEEVLVYITQHPEMYIYSKSRKNYRAVLTRHTSLVYRIQGDTIELITFWDNRKILLRY